MGNVRIMTDTTACVPPDIARQYNIKIVPAAIIMIDGKSYVENETITIKEAYELIRKDPDKFITAAITPEYLLNAFRELSRDSQEILFITISSGLSAVYKSANIATELFKEESPETIIKVLDSKSVAGGEGLLAISAARAAAKGMTLNQVTEVVEKLHQQTNVLMILDTLRYIYRTGRMSKLSARLISMLNIRPLSWITHEGMVEMADRVRNRETALKRMVELIKEKAPEGKMCFMISHGDVPEYAETISRQLQQNFDCDEVLITDYSPVMGYGGGPGAVCIAFHPVLKLF